MAFVLPVELVVVPVPELPGNVAVPVPVPDGTHGCAAIGAVGVAVGVCVVPGVLPDGGVGIVPGVVVPVVAGGVGVVVPDGVVVVVPDGGVVVPVCGGAVVDEPDRVPAAGAWLCAAMPIIDIADANAMAVVNVVSLRCINSTPHLLCSWHSRGAGSGLD